MKNQFLILFSLLLFVACADHPSNPKVVAEAPSIYPDYVDVTVPVGIAPLNFGVKGDIECMDVKSDGHPRSETFIAELRSGKGFRGARREVEEQLSEFVSRKGVVELVVAVIGDGAMSGGLGASSSSSGDSSREKPEIKFSSERRFRRKAIASKFPPGCTIKHSKYGLGEVRFIASNKLWVRFHSDPKQVLPVPSDEAELASPL